MTNPWDLVTSCNYILCYHIVIPKKHFMKAEIDPSKNVNVVRDKLLSMYDTLTFENGHIIHDTYRSTNGAYVFSMFLCSNEVDLLKNNIEFLNRVKGDLSDFIVSNSKYGGNKILKRFQYNHVYGSYINMPYLVF